MQVLVIDGQGGKLGGLLVQMIVKQFPSLELTAIGTNSTATATMVKFGAKRVATGENAIRVACRKADVIIGPIGIVIADALMGEVTPDMATTIGQADAIRILLPVNARCDNLVAGIGNPTITELLTDACAKLRAITANDLQA